MKPVRCLSPGSHVFNSDDRSHILREEQTLILMNFLALLPLFSGIIEAQKVLNPSDDRGYVLSEEHIQILMNFLGLVLWTHLSGRNIDLPAEAENRWTQMLNKYCNFRSFEDLSAVPSDLLSMECARRGRDDSHSSDEGSSSNSEVAQVFNDGSAVMGDINNLAQENKVFVDISMHRKWSFVDFNGSPRQSEEPKRNKVGCSGMTTSTSGLLSKTTEIINDSSDGINSPQVRYVSIDIPSVVNQEYEENVGGDLHGRKREIPTYRINSSPEPYISIDVPSVVDQQQRKELIGGESADTKKLDNSMISETTLAIAAQAAGALVSRAFSGSAHSSWISNFAAVGTVFGISFPLLGIGLRHVNPKLSSIMAKLGAVAMSSAIILALGLTVVPAVAWTAGTMACLLIAIGVTMA